MIKFKQGYIGNVNGMSKDIMVTAKSPVKLGQAAIGIAFVMVGIAYLTVASFKNGAKALEAAEFKTMMDLGIIK